MLHRQRWFFLGIIILLLLCACAEQPIHTEEPDITIVTEPEQGNTETPSGIDPISQNKEPAAAADADPKTANQAPTAQKPEPQKHIDPEDQDERSPEYRYMFSDMYAEYPQEFTVPENTVYLTFDDGPTRLTGDYLDVLAQYGVKATFFVVGIEQDTESGRARLKRISGEGHTIGVHCYMHDYDAIYTSVEDYLKDFYKAYSFIRDVTGEAPVIFRFPGGSSKLKKYGLRNELMAEMTRRGFVCYDWNITTADTAGNASTEACIRNVVDNCSRTQENIVLAHDGKTFVLKALPRIIEDLQDRGFDFAPLAPNVKPVLLG